MHLKLLLILELSDFTFTDGSDASLVAVKVEYFELSIILQFS